MRLHAPTDPPPPALAAAALQHDLLAAARELDRLQALLADACVGLMQGFDEAARSARERGGSARAALPRLRGAITALQFQDMASQLIAHTHRRLCGCAERIALEHGIARSATPAPGAHAPSNPVAQNAMRAGSIELF